MIPWNRVKVIATIGPATSNYKMIKKLVYAGMDIVRLNFSHGTYADHGRIIKIVRKIESEIKRPLGILADMPGPKLRLRNITSPIPVKQNEVITIKKDNIAYPKILKVLTKGAGIFISDGKIRLKVIKPGKDSVTCRVISGGELKNGAGLNFPDVEIPVPAVTPEDFKHIDFVTKAGVDFIGLSFIKEADDIAKVRKFLKTKKRHAFLISKIERSHAIDNLSGIISATDGIMVARGDLGVEMPVERITVLQKDIIKKCNAAGKPVITATQMLESMIANPSPTRAEVSDIANAILDGTDAIMLSGETATGSYPVEAVKMMIKTSRIIESHYPFDKTAGHIHLSDINNITSASVVNIATTYRAKAILIPTVSGSTARRISKYKPSSMIVALAVNRIIQRQLTISWGIYPCLTSECANSGAILKKVDIFIKKFALFKKGDKIVVTAGTIDRSGQLSNIIKITKV